MMRALFALVLMAAAALPEPVAAHALLVKASPPKRAVLRDAPKEVHLWFNERLEAAYATVSVMHEGAPVAIGDKVVDAKENRLSVQLPLLRPGSYTVRFRVLSVDGHVAEDSFGFSVGR